MVAEVTPPAAQGQVDGVHVLVVEEAVEEVAILLGVGLGGAAVGIDGALVAVERPLVARFEAEVLCQLVRIVELRFPALVVRLVQLALVEAGGGLGKVGVAGSLRIDVGVVVPETVVGEGEVDVAVLGELVEVSQLDVIHPHLAVSVAQPVAGVDRVAQGVAGEVVDGLAVIPLADHAHEPDPEVVVRGEMPRGARPSEPVGIVAVGWPLSAICLRGKSKQGGKSFISRSIGQIWISYGIFATVLSSVFAFVAPQFTGYITAVLLGFAAVMTGFILKNNYITAGGFITGIGCTVALFFTPVEFTPVFFSIASILNLIVPGIMMNKKVN